MDSLITFYALSNITFELERAVLEFWIEEDIRPLNDADYDRVLFEHVRQLATFVENHGWLIHWESENWQGRGIQQPLVLHIRFRVRVKEANLQQAQTSLTTELDTLQRNRRIADHYRGNHGNPHQDYAGEATNFDESGANPEGWEIAQKWLEAGSNVEMMFLKSRFQGVILGPRFVLSDLLHFTANQCNRNHGMLPIGNNMLIQL